MDLDMARRDEIPQQFTSEQVTTIKNAVKGRRGNVNITPYHIYDYDEHKVGEWRETIDGVKKCKPVYEITITKDTITSGMTLFNTQGKSVKNIEGMCTTDGKIQRILPYIDTAGFYISLYIDIANNALKVVFERFTSVTNLWLTISYTKTTDEWEVVVE